MYSGCTRRSLSWPAPVPMRPLRLCVDRLDLGHDAEVALAVALGADDADRRLVDQVRIGAELARDADGLGGAAGMAVDEDSGRFHLAISLQEDVASVLAKRQGAGAAKSPERPAKRCTRSDGTPCGHAVVEPRRFDRCAAGGVALLRGDCAGGAEARGAAAGGVAAERCGLGGAAAAGGIAGLTSARRCRASARGRKAAPRSRRARSRGSRARARVTPITRQMNMSSWL